jgi:hypothetical protein
MSGIKSGKCDGLEDNAVECFSKGSDVARNAAKGTWSRYINKNQN